MSLEVFFLRGRMTKNVFFVQSRSPSAEQTLSVQALRGNVTLLKRFLTVSSNVRGVAVANYIKW